MAVGWHSTVGGRDPKDSPSSSLAPPSNLLSSHNLQNHHLSHPDEPLGVLSSPAWFRGWRPLTTCAGGRPTLPSPGFYFAVTMWPEGCGQRQRVCYGEAPGSLVCLADAKPGQATWAGKNLGRCKPPSPGRYRARGRPSLLQLCRWVSGQTPTSLRRRWNSSTDLHNVQGTWRNLLRVLVSELLPALRPLSPIPPTSPCSHWKLFRATFSFVYICMNLFIYLG